MLYDIIDKIKITPCGIINRTEYAAKCMAWYAYALMTSAP